MRNKASELLSPQEIQAFTRRSDAVGALAVLRTWALIAGAFALAALWPNPFAWALAVVILGARQLALAVLMHEAAHFTLMRNRHANDVLGQWFAGAFVFQNLAMYRQHHLRHHRHTGTTDDPDLSLASAFPVAPASLRRKFTRDLSGLTGLKVLIGSLLMLSGFLQYDASGGQRGADGKPRRGTASLRTAAGALLPALLAQGLLFTALAACGHPGLYALWALAWFTVFQCLLRIRSIAEHAMTADPQDTLNNSRTTRTRWWERLLYAPLNVNYHLEHHLLAAVPYFRLPALHRRLRERGTFQQPAALSDSYAQVLKMAARGG